MCNSLVTYVSHGDIHSCSCMVYMFYQQTCPEELDTYYRDTLYSYLRP